MAMGIYRSSVKECRPVIDEHSRTYSDAVHPSWVVVYLNVITAADCGIRIIPAVTAVALNVTRVTTRHGSRGGKRNYCRYRIIM